MGLWSKKKEEKKSELDIVRDEFQQLFNEGFGQVDSLKVKLATFSERLDKVQKDIGALAMIELNREKRTLETVIIAGEEHEVTRENAAQIRKIVGKK